MILSGFVAYHHSHAALKQSLKVLFKQYGRVLDVTAHRSVRMRGQAFVTIDSIKAAALAVKEVKGFPLYGRPMVSYDAYQAASKEVLIRTMRSNWRLQRLKAMHSSSLRTKRMSPATKSNGSSKRVRIISPKMYAVVLTTRPQRNQTEG